MASKDSGIFAAEDAQDAHRVFNEHVSTMEPNRVAGTLSVYFESCEPFSVTDPMPSKSVGEPNFSRPDALYDPLNSPVLTESFELGDTDGTDSSNYEEVKCPSTQRSIRKSTSNQKTDIKLAERKSRRTSGKKPMLDLLAADFGRGRRSHLVRRARPLSWGLGGKIDELFKNEDQNVKANEYIESRNEGKAIHNSQDESLTLNKGLLKVKLRTKAIYNCQFNKIPDMDQDLESYRDVESEDPTLQYDIKGDYEKEVPSASNENLDKGMVSSKSSVIALFAERQQSEDLAGKAESAEPRCIDSGTSPDSEVINVSPDNQISGTTTEGINDIPNSSKDCISHESGDCGVGSGIPSPEIVNDVVLCDKFEHDEKQNEGSWSSGASISITTGVASSITSSREECPVELMASLQESDVKVSVDTVTVESGTKADLSIAGINLVESKNGQKLQKSSKSKSPVNKKRTNCRPKGSQASSTAKGKNKEKSGTDQADHTESLPVTGSHEVHGIRGLEESLRSTAGPLSNSAIEPKAWVCCDDCHKWRRISAKLVDAINTTECRWICKDNMDKVFADCSIPQEKSNADINAELEISDASGEEDASNTRINPSQLGQKQSIDPPQLSWKLIKTNMFLHRNRKNQPVDEIMVCHCKPPSEGRMGCRDECLNRMLNIECVKGTCPCGDFCSNQQFQKRKYSKLKCVQSGKKGSGLQSEEDIPKGRFLIEYVGEVLDMPAYEARQREYASKGHKHFYFMTLNGSEVIDACAKGNLGRFINHSCEPNCRTEKWMVNGEVCVGLFAMRDIKKGEELTFDYNYVRVFGAAAKKCVCGSSRCRGVIGGDPLNSETLVLGDSDDEYLEPITFFENTGNKLDTVISRTPTAVESTFTNNVESDQSPDEKIDDPLVPIEFTERDVSFERSSFARAVSESKIEHIEEPSPSCVQPPDASVKVKNAKSEIKQQNENITSVNLLQDDRKKKPKSNTNTNRCTTVKPKSRSKLPSPSSAVKKGKSNNKQPEIDSKPPEVPRETKKIVVDNLTGRFEAVEEVLGSLLSKGGISRRRDAWKGYLTLLCLTANGGNGEGIQSNRDLSMILDALLRTKSRTVLLDIINKNGLQMLHILLKRYRKVFSKTPILRKLLKVVEFLAETKILTPDIIIKPSPPGVESFKDSILSLTEHVDREVHQMARHFRDRHIPWSARRGMWSQLDTERMEFEQNSNLEKLRPQHSREKGPFDDADNLTDPRILEGSSASCPTSTSTDQTRTLKRKSRWEEASDVRPDFEPPTTKEFRSTNNENVDMDVDVKAPPGFSSPVNRQLLFQSNPSTDSHLCKTVMGQPQERYNSRLPTSFGVPLSVLQKTGTQEPEGAAADSWVVAPAMTFHPFPPLPKYPRDENHMNLHVKEQSWRNCNFNQPNFHRDRNPNTLGRRYFKQQKWNNSRPGQQWNPNKFGPSGFNQNKQNTDLGYGVNENCGNGFYQQQPHH